LSESPSYGKPVCLYDPSSTGAQDYLDLARELVAQGEPHVVTENGTG
jgi:chromosome partitioning protein